MCEWLVVVVIFGDLLQMEPFVPALLLRQHRSYLFLQFIQSRHVVLGTAPRDLADAVLRVAHVAHHDVLSHLAVTGQLLLLNTPNMILYNRSDNLNRRQLFGFFKGIKWKGEMFRNTLVKSG